MGNLTLCRVCVSCGNLRPQDVDDCPYCELASLCTKLEAAHAAIRYLIDITSAAWSHHGTHDEAICAAIDAGSAQKT